MTEVETRSDAVGFNTIYTIDVTRTNNAGPHQGIRTNQNRRRVLERSSQFERRWTQGTARGNVVHLPKSIPLKGGTETNGVEETVL